MAAQVKKPLDSAKKEIHEKFMTENVFGLLTKYYPELKDVNYEKYVNDPFFEFKFNGGNLDDIVAWYNRINPLFENVNQQKFFDISIPEYEVIVAGMIKDVYLLMTTGMFPNNDKLIKKLQKYKTDYEAILKYIQNIEVNNGFLTTYYPYIKRDGNNRLIEDKTNKTNHLPINLILEICIKNYNIDIPGKMFDITRFNEEDRENVMRLVINLFNKYIDIYSKIKKVTDENKEMCKNFIGLANSVIINKYKYGECLDLISEYMYLFDNKHDKCNLKNENTSPNSPFIIFPSFKQLNYSKILYTVRCPLLNFQLCNRPLLNHGMIYTPCNQIVHDITFHRQTTCFDFFFQRPKINFIPGTNMHRCYGLEGFKKNQFYHTYLYFKLINHIFDTFIKKNLIWISNKINLEDINLLILFILIHENINSYESVDPLNSVFEYFSELFEGTTFTEMFENIFRYRNETNFYDFLYDLHGYYLFYEEVKTFLDKIIINVKILKNHYNEIQRLLISKISPNILDYNDLTIKIKLDKIFDSVKINIDEELKQDYSVVATAASSAAKKPHFSEDIPRSELSDSESQSEPEPTFATAAAAAASNSGGYNPYTWFHHCY